MNLLQSHSTFGVHCNFFCHRSHNESSFSILTGTLAVFWMTNHSIPLVVVVLLKYWTREDDCQPITLILALYYEDLNSTDCIASTHCTLIRSKKSSTIKKFRLSFLFIFQLNYMAETLFLTLWLTMPLHNTARYEFWQKPILWLIVIPQFHTL